MEQNCENCNWSVPILNDTGMVLYLECHWGPPATQHTGNTDFRTYFPRVSPVDWCSQYADKEE